MATELHSDTSGLRNRLHPNINVNYNNNDNQSDININKTPHISDLKDIPESQSSSSSSSTAAIQQNGQNTDLHSHADQAKKHMESSVIANELLLLCEPEVHIIGELVGCSNVSSDNTFCYYEIHTGGNTGGVDHTSDQWILVEGESQGQTQVDYASNKWYSMLLSSSSSSSSTVHKLENFIWNHPIDLHYYTRSIVGWPRIMCELYKLDSQGFHHILGYGMGYIPSSNGSHTVHIDVWRPVGLPKEEMIGYFVPNVPSLSSTQLVHNPVKAKDDRPLLCTASLGRITLQVDVILRNMNRGVYTGYSVPKQKQVIG